MREYQMLACVSSIPFDQLIGKLTSNCQEQNLMSPAWSQVQPNNLSRRQQSCNFRKENIRVICIRPPSHSSILGRRRTAAVFHNSTWQPNTVIQWRALTRLAQIVCTTHTQHFRTYVYSWTRSDDMCNVVSHCVLPAAGGLRLIIKCNQTMIQHGPHKLAGIRPAIVTFPTRGFIVIRLQFNAQRKVGICKDSPFS